MNLGYSHQVIVPETDGITIDVPDVYKRQASEELRVYGELLSANRWAIQRGAKNVTLTNYYDGCLLYTSIDGVAGRRVVHALGVDERFVIQHGGPGDIRAGVFHQVFPDDGYSLSLIHI